MSRNGHIDLEFAGEPRRFRLAIGQLEELQEATGVGPFVLLARLMGGADYSFTDLSTILRCGLTGGGMPPGEAHRLAKTFSGMPLPELVIAAGLVLAAGLEQPEGEPTRRRRSKDEPDGEADPAGKMAFAAFYEAAGAWGREDVRDLSLWQFAAIANGVRKANDPKAAQEITAEEEDALAEMIGVE